MDEHYELVDGFFRLPIRDQSPLVGSPLDAVDLSGDNGVQLNGAEPRRIPLRRLLALGPAPARRPARACPADHPARVAIVRTSLREWRDSALLDLTVA